MTFLLAALLSFAHAGPLRDWCAKHLIATDPTEYEDASTSFVISDYLRLKVKVVWGKATPMESDLYRIAKSDLLIRMTYGPEFERERIEQALGDDAKVRGK